MKALRSALQSYGVAVLSVGLATVVRLAFDPVWQSNFPFLTFYPAVLLAASYGGLWPGIFSILLSAVTATVFWVAPRDWNRLDQPDVLAALVVYVGTCVMMVLLTNAMRRARHTAEQAMMAQKRQAAQYRRIVETANEGIWEVDAEWRTTYANPRMAEMLGLEVEELIGRSPVEFTHGEAHIQIEGKSRARLAGTSTQVEMQLRRRDGAALWVQSNETPVLDACGRVCGTFAMVTDIGERKRAEQRLRLLSAASEALSSSLAIEVVLQNFSRLLVPDLADVCRIDILTPDGRLDPSALVCKEALYEEPLRPFGRSMSIAEGVPACLRTAISENRPVVLSRGDTNHDDDRRELREYLLQDSTFGFPTPLKIKDAIIVPLTTNWTAFGVLILVTQGVEVLADRQSDLPEMSIVLELARRAAVAIHNARLYEASKMAEEQARRYAVRLQLLDENARLLSSAGLNLDKITEAATRRMAELIGDFCSIRFLEPNGVQFCPGVVRHLDPSLADAMHDADAGKPEAEEEALFKRVVESGESVWIPDMAADSFLAIGPLRIYSLMIAPLKARGRVTGVLSLMRTRPGRAYTEEDRWLLEELADRTSLAVENARLHAETSKSEERALRQVARVAALARVSKALVQVGPDPQAIFDTITKESAELLGDHCALRMLSEDGRQLPVKSFWHRRPSARMKLRELYAGEPTGLYPVYRSILESGEPLFLPENALDALQDGFYPYHLDFVERYGLTAFYVVPLRIGRRAVGTLAIGRDGNGRPYTEEDRLLFEEMADRASVAIEKAQLFEEVQQANRRKDEFLAMLGHELRNPIAAMLGAHRAADAIRDEKTQAQAHDILDRQIRHMSRLVDDLLDVSRITKGKIELKREPIELARLIRETCADMREMAETKGVQLEIEGLETLLRPDPAAGSDADFWPRIWPAWNATPAPELWVSPSEGIWVDGDRTRLMQVLTNLMTNAIKFTDDGGRIVLRVEKENRENADWISVSIRDTGIGIAPSLLPLVFDSLTQADRSLDRARGGLGLGLALARGLMELHSGEISAHSDGIGKGASFTIRLPLLPIDPPGSGPLGVSQPPAGGRGGDLSSPICGEMKTDAPARSLRVLVIDDNVDSADMICLMLKLYGHQTEAVYSSSEGLELASQSDYDAICCDIGLPEMDGYQFAREIRRRGYSGSLIAVSGYGREEDRRHSLQAGFDVHLVKPVEPEKLEKTLQEMERLPSPESSGRGPETWVLSPES